MAKVKQQSLQKENRDKFAGGFNSYLGVRQIADDESPEIYNCDFKGKGGIGNRLGFTQIGAADATQNDGVYGMGTLHTSTLHQLLRFTDDTGGNIKMEYSVDGGAWTVVADTFTKTKAIDGCQAADNFYVGNGTDAMKHWTGAAWAATTNGTIGYWPTYYSRRLWVRDETYPDRLNFSGQWGAAGGGSELIGGVAGATADKLGDFSDATAGWISFRFGSGAEITGIKVFKDNLYVFLRDSIYKLAPATSANTFTITQVTNSVGCVSHRSIAQVEEDLFFASDDGVYALGEVANYVSVRTTNKSAKIQGVFDNLTASSKAKLVGAYHNFKYHLFYSEGGSTNDKCVAFDVRYQGWVYWSNMAASAATTYVDSTDDKQLYIGNPSTSAVYKLYSGTTDDGTAIVSRWYSKSFDEGQPDTLKVYFDHTFMFGLLNGTLTLSVIFNDNEVAATESINQVNPQGGIGSATFGTQPFGVYTNTITTTDYRGVPLRLRASDKKFAVQYKIEGTGTDWRVDNITTTYKPLGHYAFISDYQIN